MTTFHSRIDLSLGPPGLMVKRLDNACPLHISSISEEVEHLALAGKRVLDVSTDTWHASGLGDYPNCGHRILIEEDLPSFQTVQNKQKQGNRHGTVV